MNKSIKKALWVFVLLISVASCSKNETATVEKTEAKTPNESCVSASELASASPLEREIIQKIDATLSAMAHLDAGYEAQIGIQILENKTIESALILSNSEVSKKVMSRSCKVCGVSSAYSCVQRISEAMENQQEFDVHVKKEGDCVILSW